MESPRVFVQGARRVARRGAEQRVMSLALERLRFLGVVHDAGRASVRPPKSFAPPPIRTELLADGSVGGTDVSGNSRSSESSLCSDAVAGPLLSHMLNRLSPTLHVLLDLCVAKS